MIGSCSGTVRILHRVRVAVRKRWTTAGSVVNSVTHLLKSSFIVFVWMSLFAF